jgi:hypothetical protein
VQQSDPLSGGYQVHWNAVGDRNCKEDPPRGRGPAVDSLDLNPAAAGVDAHDFHAVHLVAEDNGMELRHLAAKREPAGHDVSNRLPAPEAKIETTA